MLLAIGMLLIPQNSTAEGFTGKDFLTWSAEAQEAFFQNSVLMASTISSRLNADHASCVSDWYFADAAKRPLRDAEILDTIKKRSDFHPSAVVLAVIERACGQYGG